jgi:hypothetical protein
MARHEFHQSFRSSVASLFPFSERCPNLRRTKKLPGFVSVPGSLRCCSLEVRSAATMPSSRRRTQQGTLRPGETCTWRDTPVNQCSHRDGAHSCILSRRRPSTTSTLRYRTDAAMSSILALITNERSARHAATGTAPLSGGARGAGEVRAADRVTQWPSSEQSQTRLALQALASEAQRSWRR